MTVTRLEELSNRRVRIKTDEESAFVLYKGELSSYGIKEGGELSEKAYREILTELLPKRAKKRAMELLKVRPYTVRGLTEKLRDGGYPEEIIEEALQYVESYGYLDDARYARDYVYTYKERKNKARLTQDLLQKGVAKELIGEALAKELGEDPEAYEREQIEKLLRKKSYRPDEASYEEKEKLLAALCRKGFSLSLCRRSMEEFSD